MISRRGREDNRRRRRVEGICQQHVLLLVMAAVVVVNGGGSNDKESKVPASSAREWTHTKRAEPHTLQRQRMEKERQSVVAF